MESSGYISQSDNRQISGDEDDVGNGEDYEILSAMLKGQMSVVQSLKQVQMEQGQETRHIMRDLSKRIEEFGNRLEFLEQRLARESREIASLREDVLVARGYNDSIPLSMEMKLNEIEERFQQLEEGTKQASLTEDRMASIHARLLASVHSDLKAELLQELRPIKTEWSSTHRKSSMQQRGGDEDSSDVKLVSTPREYRSSVEVKTPASVRSEEFGARNKPVPRPRSVDNLTSRSVLANSQPTTIRNHSRPVQKPMAFDGSTTWEAYFAQFEIIAEVNGWDDQEKSAFLAASLKGNALSILGNLQSEDRHKFEKLVTALSNRFGSAHQSELSRVRFKNRVRQREESLPELSQDIERLSRLSYPEASATLQDVLARDQFLDAMHDEEIRLRLKHERPKNLQDALTLALEFESFQLASRQHRGKVVREATLASGSKLDSIPHSDTNIQSNQPPVTRMEKTSEQLVQIMNSLEKFMQECLKGIQSATEGRRRRRGGDGCWNCEAIGHLRRDCPILSKGKQQDKSFPPRGVQGNGR